MAAKGTRIELDVVATKESVPEMVVRRILDLVKSGVLKAGEALPPERDLAASWNVSRPSVREAMRGLAVLGVVRTRQGGGAYISDLGAERLLGPLHFYLSLEEMNVRELYDARSLIEGDVARLAAVNLSDADLTRLEALWQAQQDTLSDALLFRLSDFAFHEMIWNGAGNAFLKRIGESLNILGLEFRKRASELPTVLEQSLSDHRKLLDALKARDPVRAGEAALQHMQNVYKSTISQS